MKTKPLFIPFETSIPTLAKEKGFNEDCLAYWGEPFYASSNRVDLRQEWTPESFPFKETHYCLAPIYQQIIDWFLDKHDLDISVKRVGTVKNQNYFVSYVNFGWASDEYKDRYEALNMAIIEAFKLI